MSRSLLQMLLFHEVCHSSKIYLLIDGLKLENGILKEVGSNESDVFACLSTISFPWIPLKMDVVSIPSGKFTTVYFLGHSTRWSAYNKQLQLSR